MVKAIIIQLYQLIGILTRFSSIKKKVRLKIRLYNKAK